MKKEKNKNNILYESHFLGMHSKDCHCNKCMNNKHIENFLIKYPNVKKSMLNCFENEKNYGWFIHYKNEKELGGKSKKVKSPSFGTRIFYKFEMQNIRGFHQIWVYLKNNWELNQV